MASPYTLPEGFFYIDAASAKLYEENTGGEIVLPQLVNAPVGTTLDGWIQNLWLPHSEETAPGTGRGYVGHERLIPALGVKERIEAAGLPSDDDAPGAVATILYKISDFGATHIADHIGLVRFIPVEKGTEIVWTIKITPTKDAPPPAEGTPNIKQMIGHGLALYAKAFEKAEP